MPRKINPTLTSPIETTITALSHEGRGICQINGKTTFVEGALPSETITFTYTHKHSKFDEGKVQQIIHPAAQRITPLCPHFSICGGCSLQHLTAEVQITHKQQVLIEQLKHSTNLTPNEILSPIIGPHWAYRHKARLGVRYVNKKNRLLIGFREKNQRFIADLNSCEILHPSIGKNIITLQNFLTTLTNKEHITQLEVAIGEKNTAIIIRHLEPFSEDDFKSITAFAQHSQFHVYLQPGGLSTIHKFFPDDKVERLNYTLPEHRLEFLFHPTDFTQINPAINRKLIDLALSLLQPNSNDHVLDLFCGIGNFTLPLAKYSKHVTGIEGADVLIERAKENAQHNNLTNLSFYVSDLMANFASQAWTKMHYNKLLLDPPRSGALKIVQNINLFNPKKIVYISCNLATLARDAGELVQQGYQLIKAGVLDMFPHTAHIESIALFEKR